MDASPPTQESHGWQASRTGRGMVGRYAFTAAKSDERSRPPRGMVGRHDGRTGRLLLRVRHGLATVGTARLWALSRFWERS